MASWFNYAGLEPPQGLEIQPAPEPGPNGDRESMKVLRLQAVTDVENPYLILDGIHYPVKKAVAVHYVDALIKANGYQVPFSSWLKGQPGFEGEVCTRALESLPECIRNLIDSSKGRAPRLKVELLEIPAQ
jgi:hypothetical protein